MDRAVFFYFNQHLAESRFFLYFVAFTNFRAFDLVAGACMLLILLYYFFQQNSEGKRRIICIFIAMALSTVAVKLLDRQLDFHRLSPTLYFTNMHEPVNFVSEMTGWNVKDSSTASFPGDHGAMLLIFTAFLARYFGRKACLAGDVYKRQMQGKCSSCSKEHNAAASSGSMAFALLPRGFLVKN